MVSKSCQTWLGLQTRNNKPENNYLNKDGFQKRVRRLGAGQKASRRDSNGERDFSGDEALEEEAEDEEEESDVNSDPQISGLGERQLGRRNQILPSAVPRKPKPRRPKTSGNRAKNRRHVASRVGISNLRSLINIRGARAKLKEYDGRETSGSTNLGVYGPLSQRSFRGGRRR